MVPAAAKKLTVWMNAIASAWNMGEAPWAYVDGKSVAAATWSQAYKATGDMEKALQAVIDLAQQHGVDPKRHKHHGG